MMNEEYFSQLVASKDHFKIFDLEYRFNIDLNLLKKRYHALQKHTHPDLYSYNQAHLTNLVSLASAKINQAYEELVDPIKRSRLLLEVLDSTQALNNATAHTNELLLEQMEIHELIEDYYQAKDISSLEKLMSDLKVKQDQLILQISELFEQKSLSHINERLNQLATYQKLYLTIRARIATLLHLE